MIQEKTGVISSDIVTNSSSSNSSSWSGGEFTITGSPQAVKEASRPSARSFKRATGRWIYRRRRMRQAKKSNKLLRTHMMDLRK
eukprot:397958-Heterocapsa_arctica.AAC.1